jgi:exodeoxyribonuclease-5
MVENENKGKEGPFKKRVDELVNKDMIKPEQKEGLKNMIDSPDSENFEVAQEIIKIKVEDRLVVGLNDDQVNAFNSILAFLNDPGDAHAFVLKGYAGTGKTFLVKRILEFLTSTYPKRKIAITAPTNKAVRVLQADAPFQDDGEGSTIMDNLFDASSRLLYTTVHKLLGLKEQITNSGEQLFKPDPRDKSELSKYKYLIVDEVSMLDDIICKELMKHSDRVKIIFMGDPAQIPPVNRLDCIPFKKKNKDEFVFKEAVLKQIMRQTGEHPVVDASFVIRNNLDVKHPIPTLATNLIEDKGIVYINAATERKTVRPLLKE